MDAAVAPRTLTEHRPASNRAELVALGRLAGPLVAANLLQMAVYAVDVVFVARLGALELAASTLGLFIYSLVMWGLIGLTGACAPLIAAELGARRHAVRQVRRSFRMAMWLGVLVATPLAVAMAFGETILLAAGQDPAVADRADAFLDILLFALVPSVLCGVMRTTAAALGRPGWAMVVTAIALGVGIVANWCFVFGNAGFPRMGLEGSALASLVTTLVMTIAYAVILVRDRRLRRYRLFGRWWQTEWPRMAQIVRLGVPIALTLTFEGALFGGAAVLMGLIGVAEVAAHAVALNIAAIAFQIPLGIGQAATIRVGMAYGARDPAWVGRAGNVAVALGIGAMVLTAAAIWIAPLPFVGAYLDLADPVNAPVIALALQFLLIAAIFQLLDGAQVVTAGVLRGVQDTRAPMLIALFGYWVIGFGTSILLGFRFGWGGVGVWIGLAVGLLAVSILLLWRWHVRDRLGLLPRTA
ncbi:MATE family efflux transporter [Sphingomonas sp. TZW2008]|uniref:MATE family efflux transporter n=1 Tax=Sphingomonas sp. TZW2008 TaxID=1917973 RepID=UPI0015C4FB75|nr:MATE family efflux transporter [Sphingomonas sp. TZW2008]